MDNQNIDILQNHLHSQLTHALDKGNSPLIKNLIEQGASIQEHLIHEYLSKHCAQGNLSIVKTLLERFPQEKRFLDHLLSHSIIHQQEYVSHYLIEHHIQFSEKNEYIQPLTNENQSSLNKNTFLFKFKLLLRNLFTSHTSQELDKLDKEHYNYDPLSQSIYIHGQLNTFKKLVEKQKPTQKEIEIYYLKAAELNHLHFLKYFKENFNNISLPIHEAYEKAVENSYIEMIQYFHKDVFMTHPNNLKEFLIKSALSNKGLGSFKYFVLDCNVDIQTLFDALDKNNKKENSLHKKTFNKDVIQWANDYKKTKIFKDHLENTLFHHNKNTCKTISKGKI